MIKKKKSNELLHSDAGDIRQKKYARQNAKKAIDSVSEDSFSFSKSNNSSIMQIDF